MAEDQNNTGTLDIYPLGGVPAQATAQVRVD